MQHFKTTVYLVNELAGSSISDQFSIPLTRLKRGSVEEIDEKMAAAKAWIEAVGQYHKEKLELMGAFRRFNRNTSNANSNAKSLWSPIDQPKLAHNTIPLINKIKIR